MGRVKLVKKEREAHAWLLKPLVKIAGVNMRAIQPLEMNGSASFETLMGVARAFEIDFKVPNPVSKSNRMSLTTGELSV